MLAVHVHILNAATRRPTPVRLRVHDGRGHHFAPLGRERLFPCGKGEAVGGHVRINGENWYTIDGRCEIQLPAGVPLIIEATKGIEYAPIRHEITLGHGQISVRLSIERKLSRPGWVSGDSRCHFLSPHAAAVEADAEGLDFVNLLATPTPMLAQDGHSYYRDETLLAFSGQVQASRNVYVNTLNTHAVLGTLALLNAHRPVYPLRFGPPDHSDDWSLFDWAAQCRRKNGLAVWVNAPHGGEALAAAILGKLDAIEFTPQSMPLAWCYKAWNAGLTLPLIGGSGKESNSVALGALRTYAKCDGTYVGWIEAVRRGESFITNGPLIELNVEGSQCTATALSASTLGKLELVADGRVVAFSENGRIEHTFTNIPGWVAARCVGVAFAHTSPQWLSSRPGNKVMFHIALSECREWCELRGQYADEKWRRQLLANLDAAARITANVTEESPQ